MTNYLDMHIRIKIDKKFKRIAMNIEKYIIKNRITIIIGSLIIFLVFGIIFSYNQNKKKIDNIQKVLDIIICPKTSLNAGEGVDGIVVTAKGIAEDGNKAEQQLPDDQYIIEPETVPEHGHDFELTVSLKKDKEITVSETLLIQRKEMLRYDIGRSDPEAVQAVLYENGDLEIQGSGEVKKFKESDIPWREEEVIYLAWIDPEADVESMDYWFSGSETFLGMLCPVPDTVKTMVQTFYGCTAMAMVPDMSGAVNLEDLTGCYSRSAITDGGEWPGNLKTVEEAYKNCISLIHAADASACVQLKSMKNCYSGCTALSDSDTPDCTENMEGAYQNCLNIKQATIPSKVSNLASTYSGCTGLAKVDGTIPASCASLSGTFKDCKFLSGELKINCSISSLSGTFTGAARNGSGLTVILSWEGEESYQTPEEILQGIKTNIEQQVAEDGSSITVIIR